MIKVNETENYYETDYAVFCLKCNVTMNKWSSDGKTTYICPLCKRQVKI